MTRDFQSWERGLGSEKSPFIGYSQGAIRQPGQSLEDRCEVSCLEPHSDRGRSIAGREIPGRAGRVNHTWPHVVRLTRRSSQIFASWPD